MSLFERLGLLLLGLVLFLPGIGGRDLWNPDEPRYAEVTREMRESGDWFVPHLNGKIYSEKPPLLFWTIAGASLVTGEVGTVATRLPSLLAGIATLFLLFGMARRLFDRRVAWWSVAILATSGRILWQARVGQIDMLLLALVTLAMYFFVRGWIEHRPGYFRLFFVAAGLGTLAKGPVGLLPPLLSILAFAVLTGERSRLRELRIGSGLAIWAGVVLLWLVPGGLTGGAAYIETLVIKQNVTRFADPWHHFQPFYYYLTTVPADFLPWFFFLPGALWLGWRRATANERQGYLFACCWMVVTVLFFSISPAKRTVYVLQMFPAMAMIVAWAFSEIANSWSRLRRFALVPAGLLVLLYAALPVAWFVLARERPERTARLLAQIEPLGPGLVPVLAVLVGLLFASALAAWLLGRHGRPGPGGRRARHRHGRSGRPRGAARPAPIRPGEERAAAVAEARRALRRGRALCHLSADRSAVRLPYPALRRDASVRSRAAGVREPAGEGLAADHPAGARPTHDAATARRSGARCGARGRLCPADDGLTRARRPGRAGAGCAERAASIADFRVSGDPFRPVHPHRSDVSR